VKLSLRQNSSFLHFTCPRVEHESLDNESMAFVNFVQVTEKQRGSKVLNLFDIMAQNKADLEPLDSNSIFERLETNRNLQPQHFLTAFRCVCHGKTRLVEFGSGSVVS
jgi:hypothetical protein